MKTRSLQFQAALTFITALLKTGKKKKNEILLFAPNKEPYAAFSRKGMLISASICNGRTWYSYLSTHTEQQLGLAGMSYMEKCELQDELKDIFFP